MKHLKNTIKITAVVLIGFIYNACQEDDVLLPQLEARFTHTINQETGVVNFINTSTNADNYLWDFGDGVTSTEVNPTRIFEENTYTVILEATNVAGASDTFEDTLVIGDGGNSGGDDDDCIAETSENVDPANGDLNWTFLTNDTTTLFEAFGNISGEIVDNPVIDAVNESCKVQQVTKTAGCETWSGLGIELATALNFADANTNKVFTMKVLAETQASEVTLRLERLPFPDVDPAFDRVATVTQVGAWEELTFDFSDVTSGTFKSMIIYFERDAPCDGDVYYFDDIAQVEGTGGGGGFDGGLLTNGDFETGDTTGWIGNAANVVDQGGNFVNEANVQAAGNAFDVNLSQVVPMTNGTTYTLTFDAFTDSGTGSRTILAGIGLNESPWTAVTETATLTDTPQTFTYTLTANFQSDNSRVLFDMGAEVGFVFIDNVSLTAE